MRVIFVDQTRRYKTKLQRYAWYIVWGLALVAFAIFIYRPDWILLPPKL